MKKTLRVIKAVITWLIVIFAVLMMAFTLISTKTFNDRDKDLFGYKIFVVQSPSMAATDFDTMDVIFVKEVEDAAELEVGDIISFVSQNDDGSRGQTVTHKIRESIPDSNGRPTFRTYGTSNKNDDEALVTETYLIGEYTGKIANLGHFFNFLKSTPGYILCILLPFLLIILSEGIRCIGLFRRYKKEQLAEMTAERAKIDEERAESQRMMAELLELKKQLAERETLSMASGVPTEAASEPTEAEEAVKEDEPAS